jgi:hypothetical protein
MPDLSLENIERISRDVKKQEITFSHLLEDLVDHICCDIENEMQDGLTFYEAYNKVKQKMEPRRLKEIQEETLYAVDTKYRYMKNTMKISGVAGAILFGIAVLFKIEHWPGGGLMMTLGALILSFIFMPAALGVLWKETHSRNKLVLFVSAFLAAIFFILGTLFKIQHWTNAGFLLGLSAMSGILCFLPSLIVNRFRDQENKSKRPVYIFGALGLVFFGTGLFFKIQHWTTASVLMIIGMIILFVVVFPWYTWVSWKDEKYIVSKFLFMAIGSLAIITPATLFNLSLQYSYEDGFYSHQEQQQALYNYLSGNNNSMLNRYRDSANYKQIEQLHAKTTSLINTINDIQVKMVQESEGKPGIPAVAEQQIRQTPTGSQIQYRLLSKPFHPSPVKDFLTEGSGSRDALNAAINDYLKYVSDQNPGNDLKKYSNLLDPAIYLPAANQNGVPVSLMSGLHSLELLKNSLLTVESNLIIASSMNKKSY